MFTLDKKHTYYTIHTYLYYLPIYYEKQSDVKKLIIR